MKPKRRRRAQNGWLARVDTVQDQYRLGRGSYFATMCMLAFTGGDPNWTDPVTADWSTASLLGPSYRRGYQYQKWVDYIISKDNSIVVTDLGVITDEADTQAFDIVIFTINGRNRIVFHHKALEWFLAAHKFVVVQHAVPPKTLARIRAKSTVGTVFGHFLSYESTNINIEYTTVRQPIQAAQYANLLLGTRVNANAVTHVDYAGSQVVAGYALGMPQTAPPGHYLVCDFRKPAYSPAYLAALSTFDDLYPANYNFYFYDLTITSRYTAEAQGYDVPNSAIRTAANDPSVGRPVGTEIGPAIVNPNPYSDAQYIAGFTSHLAGHVQTFTSKRGPGVENMKRRPWGNCYFPEIAPGYAKDILEVPFFEYFWGQQAAGQVMQNWTTTLGYIQSYGLADRPFVISQAARTGDPQRPWLDSPGVGGIYGVWADILTATRAMGATIIVMTARGGLENWLFWQDGCLPPGGF